MKARLKKFYLYLTTKRAGDVVTKEEILEQSGWEKSSLAAYRSKHYTDQFLRRNHNGTYQILRNGQDVTEDDVAGAFTQVKPKRFVPAKGMELVGQRGIYKLTERIGNGAVGHVWRCVVKGSNQEKAAKMACPKEDLLQHIDDVKRRFSRECRNPANLSHPNLIRYLDHGAMDANPFLIMDVADRSVADILKNGPLSIRDSLDKVEGCLKGLQYLHSEGHVHRDVKPANILQFGETFVLADLGIVLWSDMNPEFVSAATITKDSMQLGSWPYMAPEQRDKPHDVHFEADVYALGVSWYEMLTKELPDPTKIAMRRFPPACTNTSVAQLIGQMLAYDAADRPTVHAVLEALTEIRQSA